MKNKKSKYVLEKNYIIEEELSEIDIDFQIELGIGEDDENMGTISNESNNHFWAGESHPINIDRMLKVLNKFKKNGCKYVEIMYHEDHIGYCLSGLDVKKHDYKSDVAKEFFKKRAQIEAESNKQRMEFLEQELKRLKNKKRV